MATDLTGLSGKVKASIRITGVKGIDLSDLQDPLVKALTTTFAFGTAANQANLMYHDQRSLAADQAETLDLQAVDNPWGGAGSKLNFAKVKVLLLYNASTTAAVMKVGALGATAFNGPLGGDTETYTLVAGEYWLAVNSGAGWTVDGGAKDIKVLETATLALIYDIVVIGLSA